MPALSILIKLENFVFFSHHPHPYPYMYIYIHTKIYSLFYIEEEKKGRVRLWFVSKRCEIEGEESKVDANYVKYIISLTLASFISFTHKMENKEANACERKGVSRDFSSSIINSFLLHVKRTT